MRASASAAGRKAAQAPEPARRAAGPVPDSARAGLCGSHPNDGGCRVHGLILSDEGIDHFLLDLAHRAIRKDDRTVCIDIDLNFFAVVGRSDLTNGLTEILCIVHLEYLLFMKS